MASSLIGKFEKWQLIEKIGEGDAGEVWLAKGTKSGEGVVKRPVQRAIGAKLHRQAGQITTEGNVLEQIKPISVNIAGASIKPVEILDRNPKSANGSLKTFIVLEKASGFDLDTLFNCTNSDLKWSNFNEKEKQFLIPFSRLKKFPSLLLTRMVAGLGKLLIKVHEHGMNIEGEIYSGAIWNDVKTDHIFWDPFEKEFTIIDWGNAQLLGSDRVSIDRRFSPEGDYQQLCKETQKFVNKASPELTNILGLHGYEHNPRKVLQSIIKNASKLANQDFHSLQSLQKKERTRQELPVSLSGLSRLQALATEIVAYGEAPNLAFQRKYQETLLRDLILNLEIDDFKKARNALGYSPNEDWSAIYKIAHIAKALPDNEEKSELKKIISLSLERKWMEAFWNLRGFVKTPEPDWWPDVSKTLRKHILSHEVRDTPVEILNRVILVEGKESSIGTQIESIIRLWIELEPKVLEEGLIKYEYYDNAKKLVKKSSASAVSPFSLSMREPLFFAGIVSDAWKGKDFDRARKALRQWLIHDPDRRRFFLLDTLFQQASTWYKDTLSPLPKEISPKPGGGKIKRTIKAFSKRDEKPWKKHADDLLRKGRKFRQIANDIPWLENRLKILEALSNGNHPSKVNQKYPEALEFFPWLEEYTEERPWGSEDAEKYYQALKQREYERAKSLISSSNLKTWTGYTYLVNQFQMLEKDLGGQSNHSQDVPDEDEEYKKALKVLSSMQKWLAILETKGLNNALNHINDMAEKYTQWNIVTGMKASLEQWKGVFDQKAETLDTWEEKAGVKIPEPLRNTLQIPSKAKLYWSAFAKTIDADKRWNDSFQNLYMLTNKTHRELIQWKNEKSKKLDVKLLKKTNEVKQWLTTEELSSWTKNIWDRYKELSTTNKTDREKDSELLNKLSFIESKLTGREDRSIRWIEQFEGLFQKRYIFCNLQKALGYQNHPLHNWYKKAPLKTCEILMPIAFASIAIVCVVPFIFINRIIDRQHFNTEESTITQEPIPDTVSPFIYDTRPPNDSLNQSIPPKTEETITEDIQAVNLEPLCDEFEQLAQKAAWEKYQSKLFSNEDIYPELQQFCGWQYTYKQHQMDVDLLKVLKQYESYPASAELSLRELHRQYLGAEIPTPESFEEYPLETVEYANWLRASLAICHLPTQLSSFEKQALEEYLTYHLGYFDRADVLMDKICNLGESATWGNYQEIEKKPTIFSILDIAGWPNFDLAHTNCSSVSGEYGPRWLLSPDNPLCTLPELENGLPSWLNSSALTLKFCAVEIPDNVQLTLWLSQPGLDYGLQFDVHEDNLQSIAPLQYMKIAETTPYKVGLIIVDEFPDQLSSISLNCDGSYQNLITVQPIWVDNLLFWRIAGSSKNSSTEPILLPAIASVLKSNALGLPIDFYWRMNTDNEEITGITHLYVPVLDLTIIEE